MDFVLMTNPAVVGAAVVIVNTFADEVVTFLSCLLSSARHQAICCQPAGYAVGDQTLLLISDL